MLNDAIPAVLQEAIAKLEKWSAQELLSEQAKNTIELPLYHYTDWGGLKGIIESQKVWFTHYQHLNDPSELNHGIAMAHEVARMIANREDGRSLIRRTTYRYVFISEFVQCAWVLYRKFKRRA